MVDKSELEWPLVVEVGDGTLTITRVQMRTGKSGAGARSAAAPPDYDLAMCDGFRAAYVSRTTGETYGCMVADADVAQLCSGDLTLSAVALAEVIHDSTPDEVAFETGVARATWRVRISARREGAISFKMPKISECDVNVLMKQLKNRDTRITELETQVLAVLNRDSKALDKKLEDRAARIAALEAQVLKLKLQVAERDADVVRHLATITSMNAAVCPNCGTTVRDMIARNQEVARMDRAVGQTFGRALGILGKILI